MAKKPRLQKTAINLATPVALPLDKLDHSPANVRRTNATISIEALADSIARRSLLQSLSVRPVLSDDGSETGRYEVQAGSRRLRALQLLAKQKRIPRDALIPCIVKTGGIAEDDSLAENTDREALHPLDQFRAFQALKAQGLADEDIAAAHGVTPAVVRQRLRLASASETLLAAYAENKIRLDHLMAFCLTDDHSRQDQVWSMIEDGQAHLQVYTIKRLLTEDKVPADDKRARLIGMENYTAAGGTISRDLFDEDDEGYFDDPALLNALACARLEAEKLRLLAEGWSWVETTLDSPYALRTGLGRLTPLPDEPAANEEEEYEALCAAYDALIETLPDEPDPADQRRLDELQARIDAIDDRPPLYSPSDMARGGVIVSISHDGKLQIDTGYIRRANVCDQPRPGTGHTANPDHGGDTDHEFPEHGADETAALGTPKLPDRLIHDLTAYRTAALQNALGDDFDVAFLAVLYAFVLSAFYPASRKSCLQVTHQWFRSRSVPGLDDWSQTQSLQDRHASWQQRLPQDAGALWSALAGLTRPDRESLFAHCAGLAVKAVREPFGDNQALDHASALAGALSLDMTAAGFNATVETYFGRITKHQIIEAVTEARGSSTARLIEHLKKPDMAREAARLVEGTGWLPPILRSPDAEQPTTAHASAVTVPEETPIPAFVAALAEGSEACA